VVLPGCAQRDADYFAHASGGTFCGLQRRSPGVNACEENCRLLPASLVLPPKPAVLSLPQAAGS
jgi:hypothetical protein